MSRIFSWQKRSTWSWGHMTWWVGVMDLVTVGRVDERCWIRDGRWGHFQMDLEESCLLMRTSRRRSLALILLYSLYSSSIGTRSSFCTFLRGERSLENQQRPIKVRCLRTIKGWVTTNQRKIKVQTGNYHQPSIMLIKVFLKLPDGLPQFLLLCSGFPELFQQLWPGGSRQCSSKKALILCLNKN